MSQTKKGRKTFIKALLFLHLFCAHTRKTFSPFLANGPEEEREEKSMQCQQRKEKDISSHKLRLATLPCLALPHCASLSCLFASIFFLCLVRKDIDFFLFCVRLHTICHRASLTCLNIHGHFCLHKCICQSLGAFKSCCKTS